MANSFKNIDNQELIKRCLIEREKKNYDLSNNIWDEMDRRGIDTKEALFKLIDGYWLKLKSSDEI